MKVIFYVALAIIFFVIIVNVLRNFYSKYMNQKEGMIDASGNKINVNVIANPNISPSASSNISVSNGIADNGAKYSSKIKSEAQKLQASLSIDKYQPIYENIIINMDDLLNSLMLKKILTIDPANPSGAIEDLSKLHQAKGALNSAMKFIDSQ
jgi:hypothetical protein